MIVYLHRLGGLIFTKLYNRREIMCLNHTSLYMNSVNKHITASKDDQRNPTEGDRDNRSLYMSPDGEADDDRGNFSLVR